MRGAKPLAALEVAVAQELACRADETLVVALSGGPDSVALATLASKAARDARARIVLAHVNHGRRARATQDEAVCLAVGARLGVRVVVRTLTAGSSSEARLRAERYAALADVARATGAHRIATAHHARDQSETVLLALFRGTSPAGLGGMAPQRRLGRDRELVRPLLRCDPLELRAYCALQHLPFALDPTNADTTLRRNAVRALLAGMRPQFPGLDAAVARCAEMLRAERGGDGQAELRRALRDQLVALTGDGRDTTFVHLEAAAKAIGAGRPGRHFVRRGVEVVIR